MKQFNHIPVLLDEVLANLQIKEGEKYIDATLGLGGHTREIIKRGGIVLGIDQDSEALMQVEENVALKRVRGNFKNITQIAQENGFTDVSGILFDLGISSYQLDNDARGFSIKRNAPLDMRMDTDSDIRARDIINTYSKDELVDLFQRFGEEEQANEAAIQIIKVRSAKKIETTGELVSALAFTLKRKGMIHPATKIFQALRIEVNQELESLKKGLEGVLTITKPGARILVISFHSLEDRITKRYFSDWEHKGIGTVLTKKPITATVDEVRSNPRARSAKMRIFELKK